MKRWDNFITNWGRYCKLGQFYCKSGQVLQVKAFVTKIYLGINSLLFQVILVLWYSGFWVISTVSFFYSQEFWREFSKIFRIPTFENTWLRYFSFEQSFKLQWCRAQDLFGSQIPVTTGGLELRISCIRSTVDSLYLELSRDRDICSR